MQIQFKSDNYKKFTEIFHKQLKEFVDLSKEMKEHPSDKQRKEVLTIWETLKDICIRFHKSVSNEQWDKIVNNPEDSIPSCDSTELRLMLWVKFQITIQLENFRKHGDYYKYDPHDLAQMIEVAKMVF
jgi:hypothetical protein